MKNLLIISIVILFTQAIALAEELSYSGRLVHANGSPVTGLVDLKFDVAYSGAPTVIICTKTLNGVALSNGVFHVSLDIENSDCTPSKAFKDVLSDVPANESVILQVTDSTNGKVYPHQALKSVPFSIQSNIAKTLSVKGTNGQVLKLVAGEWVAADGGGSGSVTEIQTGSGLSGGPITSTGTISIATNGVTSSHILDGTISNADINASAGIARSKIAGSLANHVVINDGAGLLSAVSHLPVSLGGTGAGNASDARNNLGLGNVATRDVGLNSGNVLLADEVPSCLAHQKIQKTVLAPYIFSCADDNDSADVSKLPLLGGTMLGAINMGGFAITNLIDPTNAQDAATRNYVHTYVASELLGVSESQWIDSGSDIHFSAGNVGIGTASPGKILDIQTSLSGDGVKVKSTDASFSTIVSAESGTNILRLVAWGSSTTNSNNLYSVNPQGLNISSSTNMSLMTNGSERIRINSTGNVGIGATNPSAKLEVAGQVKITGGAPGAGKVLTSDAAGLATWETPSAPTSGSINSSHILDGSIVDADINASAAIAQSKIANLTTDLASKQASDPDLAALAALSSFGILVRDSSNSFVTRTLMGAAGRTFISNANGAGGNPTINISNGLLPSPLAGDAGKFLKATGTDTSAWSALASGDITTALGFTPVNKAGDTMTGALTLSGDPTDNLHAATKQYVDSATLSGNLWTLTSGNIYRTSNVGIGTTSAANLKLTVGGPTAVTTDYGTSVLISGTATSAPTDSGTARLLFEDRNSSTRVAAMAYGANLLSFGTLSATGAVWTNDKMLNIQALTGNVGIGTASPGFRLQVDGTTFAKGNLYLTPTNGLHWYEPVGSLSSKIFTKTGNTINGDLELWTSGTGLEIKNPWGQHSIFVQLGDSSTGGNVGIGTKNPGAKLEVAGQVKITGGAPGAGKVLTSDGVGLASWQTPAAGGITALTGDVTASGSGSVTATLANDAVTSAKILNGTIVDADIANTTITYSKLNLADQSIPVAKLVRLTCLAGEVITSDAVLGYRCVTDNATDTTKVPLAGGTMTGLLTLSADPTANLHAATKQYVDSTLSSHWTASSGNLYRSTGNVAIGTTNPTHKLTVVNASGTNIRVGSSTSVDGGFLTSNNVDTFLIGAASEFDGANHIARASSPTQIRMDSGNIHFQASTGHTIGATYTPTTRMTILSSGNVSVGSTSANEKLTVEGVLSLREVSAPTATANYGKIYVNSTDSKLYFVNDSGTSVELGVNNAVGASTTSTISFSSSNMVRSTKSTSCGSLVVSGTTAGKTYTLTMPNTTATCLLPATIDGLAVKAPLGYVGGNSIDGVVYTFINDGFNVWVSHVDF